MVDGDLEEEEAGEGGVEDVDVIIVVSMALLINTVSGWEKKRLSNKFLVSLTLVTQIYIK